MIRKCLITTLIPGGFVLAFILTAMTQRTVSAQSLRNVTIEMRAIEISRKAFKDLGIDWDVSIGRTVPHPSIGRPRGGVEVAAQVRANDQKRKFRSQTVSTLTTLDGRSAQFFVGNRTPFTITYYSPYSVTHTVQFVDFGVRSQVKPQILGDGKIKLDLRFDTSTIDPIPSRPIPGSSFPEFKNRTTETSVVVEDGEPVIAGSFYTDQELNDLSAIPGISNVPILGELFKQRRRIEERGEFVLFITARST